MTRPAPPRPPITRRQSLVTLLAGPLITALPALTRAQASAPAPDTSSPLHRLTEAADAVIAIARGLGKLIARIGPDNRPTLSAAELAQLQRLIARSKTLLYGSQMPLADLIDNYLRQTTPDDSYWAFVTRHIDDTLGNIKTLLRDLSQQTGDLVLQDSFTRLNSSLGSRALTLDLLKRMPPPRTAEQRQEVAALNGQYKRLLAGFGEVIEGLEKYAAAVRTS